MSDTVYTLIHNGDICGIFKDESSLCASLSSLRFLVPDASFEAKKVLLGSNIVVNHLSQEDIEGITKKLVEKVQGDVRACGHKEEPVFGEVSMKIPVEIRSEVKKVKAKYAVFVENLETFHRLLHDNVIQLNMKLSKVPELFHDKFYIFRDIVLNKVPDEDAFGYFMDRYTPNNQFVLETVNDISSNSSSSNSSEDTDSDKEESDTNE